jgi:hypothetical protein
MVLEKCMLCLECVEPSQQRYCKKCSNHMCDTCEERYLRDSGLEKGCPVCRSTDGVLYVHVEVDKHDNLLIIHPGNTITLRKDGERQCFPVSSRAARTTKRNNQSTLNKYINDDMNDETLFYDMIMNMFTVITHAVINNLSSNQSIHLTFKESLRTPFLKIAYSYSVHVF